jgi:NAD binding domain of 6-phosphogluconate dehydrogenase
MTNAQSQQRYHIGMVGLDVMGRNLVLNTADHGFSVAGYDKDQSGSPANRGFYQRALGRHRQRSHRRPSAGTVFRGWHNGYWVSKNTS